MSYLDFWWAIIVETLGVILRKLIPYIVGVAVLVALVILAWVFLWA